MNVKALVPILAFLIGGEEAADQPDEVLTVESQIRQQLDGVDTDVDFTLIIEAENGRRLTHSVGDSTPTTGYHSASTSKLVTATVVLWFVEQGEIALSANPQDHIDGWPTQGNLAGITLEQLLSFTSGLANEPICISLPMANFTDCVENIASSNSDSTEPGQHFHYGSAHMQVAGAMVVGALGLNSWSDVFQRFQAETGLLSSAAYIYPSPSNPRLAGGMTWQASEYMMLLEALFRRSLFSPHFVDVLTTDRLVGATVDYSPVEEQWQESWHYGLGVWLECRSTVFDCEPVTRFSSPGSFGAYPFWDEQNQYFGILAREGDRGTAEQGIQTLRQIEDLLIVWSSLNAVQ